MKTFTIQVWTRDGERYREVGVTNAANIDEIAHILKDSRFCVVNEATGVVFLRNDKGDVVIVYECAFIPVQELAARLNTIIAAN